MSDQSSSSIPKTPDYSEWSIPTFYQKSWDLVKIQPVLWLFGLAAVIFTGSSFRFNGGGNGSSSDKVAPKENTQIEKGNDSRTNEKGIVKGITSAPTDKRSIEDIYLMPKEGVETSNVVKPKTEEEKKMEAIWAFVAPQFRNVPAVVYMLLFLEIPFLFVFSTITAVTAVNWSTAAQFKGFEYYSKGEKASISKISTRAAAYVLPAFKYNLLVGIVLLGSILMGVLLFAIFIGIASVILPGFIVVIAGIILFVLGVYLWIRLLTAVAWGNMFLFLENTGAKGAFDAGMQLSRVKGMRWKTILLTIVNLFASGIVGMLALIPLGIMVGVPVAAMVIVGKFSLFVVPFFAVALFVGFPFMMFVNSIMKSITAGTWYFAFQAVKNLRKTE